jgi:hypothetical protein
VEADGWENEIKDGRVEVGIADERRRELLRDIDKGIASMSVSELSEIHG